MPMFIYKELKKTKTTYIKLPLCWHALRMHWRQWAKLCAINYEVAVVRRADIFNRWV